MNEPGKMNVEVVFASPGRQIVRRLQMDAGKTVAQAITESGILAEFPEIDLSRNRVGIYGKLVTLERVLGDHERVEILRPLIADPKEARRTRAGKALRK